MIDFKDVAIYLFLSLVALVVYLWKGLDDRIKRIERRDAANLSEAAIDAKITNAKSDINLRLVELTSSLNNFVSKMEERHARFERIERKFEEFLESRKDLHNYLEKISEQMGTRQELLRAIEAVEQISSKIK